MAPGQGGSSVSGGQAEMLALTGLRIVAALWVVAFHFHFTSMSGVEKLTGWLGPLVTQGALGVDLFFVLSGFVIAWTYLDQLGRRLRLPDAREFVWARAARMWPAYAVVFHLFGVWLVARAVLGGTEDVAYQAVQPDLTPGAWLEQALLVQMWNEPYLDGASWVGPTWSISAEWLAYLLFPLLALVFFRLRNLPFVVLAAGSLLCVTPLAAAFVVVGSPYYPYSWLVRILGGFSAGVLAMLAVRRLRGSGYGATASSVATVAAVAVPLVLCAGGMFGSGWYGLAILFFPVLVGALALADRGPVHHLLTRRPMVHGGRMSYALYLVHIPMFEIFWFLRDSGAVPPGGVTGHLIALTVVVGTLPVAQLLYSFVERPARRWMRALPFRRVAAAGLPAQSVRTPGDNPVDNRRSITTDDARRDPATSVLPAIGPAGARAVAGRVGGLPRGPRPPAPTGPLHPARPARGASVPVVGSEPDPGAPASPPEPDEPVVVPAAPTRLPAREADPAVVPAAARWDRAGSAPAGPGTPDRLARDLVNLTRSADQGEGPIEPDRLARMRALQLAAHRLADGDGGVVPAPRALYPSAALPGTRSGAEVCGRSSRRRDAHASAATPIVAASAAAARRGRRPAHGA